MNPHTTPDVSTGHRPVRIRGRLLLTTVLAILTVVVMGTPPLPGPSTTAWASNPCITAPEPPPDCDPPEPSDPPSVAAPEHVALQNVTSKSATLTWRTRNAEATDFRVRRYQRPTAATPAVMHEYHVTASPGTATYSLPQEDLPPLQSVGWSVEALAPGRTQSAPVWAGTLTVDLPSSGPALSQLSAFRADWQTSAFPRVNKAEALADALRIVKYPRHSIDQGKTGACGPATAEFALVARDPGRFVTYVRSIASTGQFAGPDGTRYIASRELRASGINPTVSPANWLFMATIKDARNAIRITSATPGNHAAWISSPADVAEWQKHIVGLRTTTATAILRPVSTGSKVMPSAASVLQRGGSVILLVDSTLVGNRPGLVTNPNHYVNLLAWSSSSRRVRFTVATWGEERSVETTWSTFDSLTWDVITAR